MTRSRSEEVAALKARGQHAEQRDEQRPRARAEQSGMKTNCVRADNRRRTRNGRVCVVKASKQSGRQAAEVERLCVCARSVRRPQTDDDKSIDCLCAAFDF